MGHEIHHDDFKVTTSKERILAMVSARAERDGDYHEPITSIEWQNRCFDSREDAEKYLNNLGGFYRQVAVQFKYQNDFVPSKALENTTEKARQAIVAYRTLNEAFHFGNHKSAIVGCKNCGSKIALKYLRSNICPNICPVCRKDLRPETTQKRIKALKEKAIVLIDKRRSMERAEREKNLKKAETYWLVKTEFHV